MIMDEPTNHLDIDTVEALAQALRLFLMIIFFYLDDEGSVLTPSFVVITIDVNENVANVATQGVQRRRGVGLSRSESASECLPPGLYFTPFSIKINLRWNFPFLLSFFVPAVDARYNCITRAQVWVCQGGTVKVAQGGVHEYKRKVEKAFAATK